MNLWVFLAASSVHATDTGTMTTQAACRPAVKWTGTERGRETGATASWTESERETESGNERETGTETETETGRETGAGTERGTRTANETENEAERGIETATWTVRENEMARSDVSNHLLLISVL